MSARSIFSELNNWFVNRNIRGAIVGFSGGVDSATTTALLARSGLSVTIVVAEAPNQQYASPYGGEEGAHRFLQEADLSARIIAVSYPHLFLTPEANEAAAPIMRVASFYGVAATLRKEGLSAVVVGTANFDEAGYLGFWGKASDGAQDLYPISHLHKSQVLSLAKELGVPDGILQAIPSGDLLFEQTNDLKMIGASYPQIESIALLAEQGASCADLARRISSVQEPLRFKQQVLGNYFKYQIGFPGFHISDRLERFRREAYPRIIEAMKSF